MELTLLAIVASVTVANVWALWCLIQAYLHLAKAMELMNNVLLKHELRWSPTEPSAPRSGDQTTAPTQSEPGI